MRSDARKLDRIRLLFAYGLWDENQDSLVELGLLSIYRLSSAGYGTSCSLDGCRRLSVHEPREVVVPSDPFAFRIPKGRVISRVRALGKPVVVLKPLPVCLR